MVLIRFRPTFVISGNITLRRAENIKTPIISFLFLNV